MKSPVSGIRAALLAAAAAALLAGGAGAQEPDSTWSGAQQAGAGTTAATADSTKADTTGIDKFILTSISKLDFTESYYQAESGFNSTIIAPGGWYITNNMLVTKKNYRGRDMAEIRENMMSSAAKMAPGMYSFTVSVGENYMKQKSLGLARYGKDIIIDRQSASVGFKVMKPLLGASSSLIFINGEAVRGQNDFKFDRAGIADAGSFLSYRLGERIKVAGGVGTHLKNEGSDVGPIEFRGIPSHVDTVRASLDIEGYGGKLIGLRYTRQMGVIREVAPPFGNSMEIIDNPELAVEEENRINGENIHVESSAEPLDRLTLGVTFDRDYSDQSYLVEQRRNKETETSSLEASAEYKYAAKGSASITMRRGESDTDFGPTSVASFRTKENSISGAIYHTIHDSLVVELKGAMSLTQKFYKKREQNPRDVDLLSGSMTAKVSTWLFGLVQTEILGYVSRYETINIDASISGDNRIDYRYQLKPQFTIKPLSWVTVKQGYEINMDYTEFTFDSDRNYLDRNTTLVTEANIMIIRPLRFSFNHRYQMKDTGSYLSSGGGEKLYTPSNENVENRLRMNLEYKPSQDLTIFINTSFRDQKNNTIAFVGGKRVIMRSVPSEAGDFRAGINKTRNVTSHGKLDLDIAYVKRYGPFLTEDRKQYWEVNANLTIDF